MIEKLIPSRKSYNFFQNLHNTTPDNVTEVRTPISLQKTSGNVPDWLNGIMYRIGPGIFQIPQEGGTTYIIRHAFDGLPVAHRFEISGASQTITYNSRCLADGIASDIKQKRYKGLIYFGHIAEVSFFSWVNQFLSRLPTVFHLEPRDQRPDAHNAAVTVTPNFPMPKKYATSSEEKVVIAKTDANLLQKINATTLEPERAFNYSSYNSKITGPFSAAHHQTDLRTGEVYNFTGDIAPRPSMNVFSVSSTGESILLAKITHRLDEKKTPVQLPYIHSFWLTENYVIIPEFPLSISGRGIDIMVHGAIVSSLTWDKDRPTYMHVIRRKLDNPTVADGLVASIAVPGFFEFHTANAFESLNENNEIILNLDCCAYKTADILFRVHSLNTDPKNNISTKKNKQTNHNGINDTEDNEFGELRRYALNLTKKKQENIHTFVSNMEFPRFNQEYLFKKYSYVYGAQLVSSSKKEKEDTFNLIKVNLIDNSTITFEKEGYSFSEPVFVQRSLSSEAEDDGVLLTLGNTENCCYIVIVNAATMKELACFSIGEFKTSTLHGSFVDYDFTPININ